MPGFATVLNDSEIIAILAYVKSTWSIAIRAKQDVRNEKQ
jgi:mono/diheme cytochrome c family protein